MSYLERKRDMIMSVQNTVRGYLRTTFGEPPLTLTDTYPDKLKVKLYGKSTQESGTYYTANRTITEAECNYGGDRRIYCNGDSNVGWEGQWFVRDSGIYWYFTSNGDLGDSTSRYYIDCATEKIFELTDNDIEINLNIPVYKSYTAPSGYNDFAVHITSRTGELYPIITAGTACSFGTIDGKYMNFTAVLPFVAGTVLEYNWFGNILPAYILRFRWRKFTFSDLTYYPAGNYYIQDGSDYYVFVFASTLYGIGYHLDTNTLKIYSDYGTSTVICTATKEVSAPAGFTDITSALISNTGNSEILSYTESETATGTILTAENVTSNTYPDPVHPQTITSPTAGGTVRGKNLFGGQYLLKDKNIGNAGTGGITSSSRTDTIVLPVKPGDVLTASEFKTTSGGYARAVLYDENMNRVSNTNSGSSVTTVIPQGVYFYGHSSAKDSTPMLELGSTATAYSPYQSTDITITKDGQPVKLYGLPVSSDGNVTIGGQQYLSDVLTDNGDGTGTVERKVGTKIPYHTDTIMTESSNNFYTDIVPDAKAGNIKVLCTHFTSQAVMAGTNNIFISRTKKINFQFNDIPHTPKAFQDFLQAQETAGTPVTVLYAKATPTYEPVTITKNKAMNGTTIITSDCPYIGAEYYSWEREVE